MDVDTGTKLGELRIRVLPKSYGSTGSLLLIQMGGVEVTVETHVLEVLADEIAAALGRASHEELVDRIAKLEQAEAAE